MLSVPAIIFHAMRFSDDLLLIAGSLLLDDIGRLYRAAIAVQKVLVFEHDKKDWTLMLLFSLMLS